MNKPAHWWYNMPLLRLLIPFILGILSYTPNNHYPFLVALSCTALLIFLIRVPLKTQLLKKGLAITGLLYMAGFAIAETHDIRNKTDWFGNQHARGYILKLINTPMQGTYDKTAIARVEFVKTEEHWIPTSGILLLKFPIHSNATKQTVLYTQQSPKSIPDTGSRKTYARYLANQHIYHQLKLKEKEFQELEQPLIEETIIEKAQRSTLRILDQYFSDQTIRGLAKALLVGYRGELDKTLNSAYINTGVVHVIAISGLHLGLIYGLLMLLFKPIQHIRPLRIGSCIVVIILLWIFTIMCGATPSVVRSAIMFSFLILGKIIQAKPSTGNMLAASALVMLSINPFLLYDIGFQLSYAAVTSLLIYNKSISTIFEPENGLLKVGWSSISTSLSAQILTTPFVLFHFHQFPLIFILSNIIAIPLSSIALLLLIVLCAVTPLPGLASLLAKVAYWSMWLMNDRIIALAALPFSKWENLPFNMQDLLFSLLSIGILTIYFKGKQPIALKSFLCTVLIWSILYHYSS